MTDKMEWQEVVSLHGKAIDCFTQAALDVPAQEWTSAADDKWAPAHVTEHLSLVYKVLLAELDGGQGMKVRTNFLVRQLLRWIYVPRLLRGDPFPPGTRAPRETRPALVRAGNQAGAVEALNQLAERFQEKIQRSYAHNPKTQLTHAYFGSSTLNDSLLLCARHIQHHTKKLVKE